MARRHRIGELLLAAGHIDEFQLRAALADQERWGGRLGAAFVRLGFLTELELAQALAGQLGVPVAQLEGKRISPAVLELVPAALAEKYGCIPLFTKQEGGVEILFVGMEDPADLHALDDLTFRTGMKVRAAIVTPSRLRDAQRAHYREVDGDGGDAARGFDETPLDPSDTAPLLPELSALGVDLELDEPSQSQDGDGDASRAGKPRDVPTRTILRAITQLLIDKDVIQRDELIERIQSLARPGDGDP